MNFESIVGNTEMKEYLIKSIKQKNILHSYLFLGTYGIGKLLIAKAFAKKILCLEEQQDMCHCKSCLCIDNKNHPDCMIINEEGNNIKIDQIREITEKIIEKPIISSKKVYIINDCEKMTKEAQNCLLKTLEEPPEFVTMILISSNENLILNTIKSRCMSIKFKNIEDNELREYARNIIGYENITENLLKTFNGSIGKAIKLKDNSDKYLKIESFILSLPDKDLIDIMLDGRILYDKEDINDVLEYIMICLYANKNQNKNFVYAIQAVNKCFRRLNSNSNFDMSIDTMLFEMWEELNENRNRC